MLTQVLARPLLSAGPTTRLAVDALGVLLLHSTVGPGLRVGTDIEIRPSPGRGSGAFALRDIPALTYIGRYCGEVYTESQFREVQAAGRTSGDYAFGAGEGIVVDAEDPTRSSWLRYINHSVRCENVMSNTLHMYGKPTGLVYMYSIRDIPAGQEIFADYGREYWDGRLPPLSPKRIKVDYL